MILTQLQKQLDTLTGLLYQLTDEQYTRPIRHLNHATIGAHSRHIIEILQCILNGYDQGRVDYIHRDRNLALETNRELALQTIVEQWQQLDKADKPLELFVETESGTNMIYPFTTYLREIIYTIEHTVHHLALIKVALTEMELKLVHEHFGVAYSTIVYRNTTTTA